VLTLQLDPDLHFVSASTPPASGGPTLTWNTAANAGAITITASVGPGAALFDDLTSTAGLALAATELEAANNTAASITQLVARLFLPFMGDVP
jgi:hypothetical protein